MRKISVVFIAAVLTLALGTAVMAQELLKLTGKVTKIDTATNGVTIQPQEGAEVTVIMENAEMLSKVKEGEKGEARYTVKDGKNMGTRLRKIIEGCPS